MSPLLPREEHWLPKQMPLQRANRSEVKTEQLKKLKMLIKPSQSGLPLPFGFQPLPLLSLSPQCPQAGLSPVFNSIQRTLHTTSPILGAHTGEHLARNANARPLHTILEDFCDTNHLQLQRMALSMEDARESQRWTSHSSSQPQLSSADAPSSLLPFPRGGGGHDELPARTPTRCSARQSSPFHPASVSPPGLTDTSLEGLNVQNG